MFFFFFLKFFFGLRFEMVCLVLILVCFFRLSFFLFGWFVWLVFYWCLLGFWLDFGAFRLGKEHLWVLCLAFWFDVVLGAKYF